MYRSTKPMSVGASRSATTTPMETFLSVPAAVLKAHRLKDTSTFGKQNVFLKLTAGSNSKTSDVHKGMSARQPGRGQRLKGDQEGSCPVCHQQHAHQHEHSSKSWQSLGFPEQQQQHALPSFLSLPSKYGCRIADQWMQMLDLTVPR